MSLRASLRLVALAAALGGCGTAGLAAAGSSAPGGRVPVVAAESFWASLAAQLGGAKVSVQSVITNPNVDPHSYEPVAADAVAFARARLAIVNGIGYDAWASQLIDADSAGRRAVLNVGQLLDLKTGDNPHQWYSPASVQRVIAAITSELTRADPRDAAYFAQRRETFVTQGLAAYHRLIADIRHRYAGVPVGYSESIFAPLGTALGLKLLTPPSFAKAIAEGTDVTAGDRETVDAQAQERLIKVWVYNRQNATPDVQRVNQLVRAAGIPITTITETLDPPSATFEQWQDTQLRALEAALHQATGR